MLGVIVAIGDFVEGMAVVCLILYTVKIHIDLDMLRTIVKRHDELIERRNQCQK